MDVFMSKNQIEKSYKTWFFFLHILLDPEPDKKKYGLCLQS